MPLTVGVPREVKTAEHRVALTPDGVRELERHNISVFVEAGAGTDSAITDAEFAAAGCRHRADGRRRMGPTARREGERAAGVGVRLLAARPHAVHVSPPRRLPGGGGGVARIEVHGHRLRDGATRQRRPAAAGADVGGGRASGDPSRRALPRAAQRRARRAAGRRARGATGASWCWAPATSAGTPRGSPRAWRPR